MPPLLWYLERVVDGEMDAEGERHGDAGIRERIAVYHSTLSGELSSEERPQ